MLLLNSYPATAETVASDEYLTGYVASILERDLGWEKNSYLLKMDNGVATITVFKEDPIRREAVDKKVRTLNGLRGVTLLVDPVDPDRAGAFSRFLGLTGDVESFPVGDVFRPLLADPKQPQFFVSVVRFHTPGVRRYNLAAVGFGETFGFYRFLGSSENDGLQLSMEAALFAQFNLNTHSYDLQNADYTIGIPITYRHGDNSLRFRIYHQSSHLGDELLLSTNPPSRVNLSFEAVELIYSREWRGWRVYGGGEYLIDKDPKELKPLSAHWGLEFRGSNALVWGGRPIVAADMKSLEEHDWALDTSIKAGLEFGHPNPGQRRLRVLAEWYKGADPHGQFYAHKVDYLGLGIYLGF
jgi:hypothetical protein